MQSVIDLLPNLVWPVALLLACLIVRKPLVETLNTRRGRRYGPCFLLVLLGALLISFGAWAWGAPALTGLLGVFLSWPVVALVLVLVFRREVRQLINRIKRIGFGGNYCDLLDAGTKRDDRSFPDGGASGAAECATDSVFSDDDLVREFTGIGIAEADVRAHLDEVRSKLFRYGIVTKGQLAKLASSKDVLTVLSALYITELMRPPDSPLDACAVATWAAPLFAYGLRPDLVDQVRFRLRKSDEYRDRH